MKKQFLLMFLLISIINFAQNAKIWSTEKANKWYKNQGWLVGSDFLPSSAINQLEMWQAATFDTATTEKEFGWAENIGMNTMRVYLHDLVWKDDAIGYKKRINTFLSIASKHHIKPVFVFFDDCWNPEAIIGKQPDPQLGVHNSGWVRSPGKTVHNDPTKWNYLEKYVKDILTTFKNDNRILLWDLYNEPGNSGYELTSLPLLKKIYEWAWSVRPSQPISTGVWNPSFVALNAFQLENSDVITFHNYEDANSLTKTIDSLLKRGRPLICTEYMARRNKSLFVTHLPIFKKYNVAAINWGFVSGKSNTIFAWDDKSHPDGKEPALWFHDIYRKDGTPFDVKEVEFIKSITKH